jgi:diguanylate cyclase (GGDEF)-like protein/PAS domain S-box-containing protein
VRTFTLASPVVLLVLSNLGSLAVLAGILLRRRARVRTFAAVTAAEERYRGLVEHVPLILYIDALDSNSSNIYTSPQTTSILGYTPEEWVNDPELLEKLLHPDDRRRVMDALHVDQRSPGDHWDDEYRLIARDGRVVWIEDLSSVVYSTEGVALYAQGYLRDVTETKLANQALRDGQAKLAESEARFRAILETVQLLAVVVDTDGCITFANDFLVEVSGWSREELIGQRWYSLLDPNPAAQRRYLEEIRTGMVPVHTEGRIVTRSGEERVISWSGTLLHDPEGNIVARTSIGEDITARRTAEERIAFLSRYDELTGLPNRNLFGEWVDLALAQADKHDRSVAVLFVDLDNFKLVNDSYGHATGDEMLKQFGHRLRDAAFGAELVARQSGDEFLVLVADTDTDEGSAGTHSVAADVAQMAEALAGRIRHILDTPFKCSGDEVYLTASVGVSLYPGGADDREQLLTEAHVASYRHKGRAGGRHGATTGLPPREELSLISRLHRAIERAEFVLHYQPVVRLDSGRPVGVEALIRWQPPGGELIPPGQFIPLAERTGLIAPMTEWVVAEVCRQRIAWRDAGIKLEVAFNFPAVLWDPATVRNMLRVIRDQGLSRDDILLEITESTAATESNDNEAVLSMIRQSGLRLAIDDFGTGYSSLSRLKQLPATTLKLDRSFVRDLPDDPDSAAMAITIIDLARNLGLNPLAEGIETEAQRRFLVDRGCRLGQGFLFSRPVTADAIITLFRDSDRRAA